MKLEISSFADGGVFDKERVVLKALSDVDIGSYALLCSAITSERTPTAGNKSCYWFPDKQVKAGDLVVLYTKRGTSSTKDLKEGRTAHFYYWGMQNALWGGNGNGAVLLNVSGWKFKIPADES